MKAVAVSAEYFDDCQSSSPRQGPGANSFSLLMREIQSVLFYTSIFNIINFQVFVNTEFMKDTGNGVHNGYRKHSVLDEYRKHRVHVGNRKHRIHVGYRKGWTDHKNSGEPPAVEFLSRVPPDSLRLHSGISSGHRDVITDFLHAEFHASAAFRRFVTGAYFSVIKEIFAPHVSR